MRAAPAVALSVTMLGAAAFAQTLDKELVASISGPALYHGIVSELLWDGGTLIIQSAVVQADGQLAPRYFAAPAANMELRPWSDDGQLIAVTERKDDGARWDISIVRVPERFRQ